MLWALRALCQDWDVRILQHEVCFELVTRSPMSAILRTLNNLDACTLELSVESGAHRTSRSLYNFGSCKDIVALVTVRYFSKSDNVRRVSKFYSGKAPRYHSGDDLFLHPCRRRAARSFHRQQRSREPPDAWSNASWTWSCRSAIERRIKRSNSIDHVMILIFRSPSALYKQAHKVITSHCAGT